MANRKADRERREWAQTLRWVKALKRDACLFRAILKHRLDLNPPKSKGDWFVMQPSYITGAQCGRAFTQHRSLRTAIARAVRELEGK